MSDNRLSSSGPALAGVFGVLAGAVAAAHGQGFWPSVLIGLATAAVLLGVDLVTGLLSRPRVRRPMIEASVQRQTEPAKHKAAAAVFVHGLMSSPEVWTNFRKLIDEDPKLDAFDLHTFGYSSPRTELSPTRCIPTISTVAMMLATYLDNALGEYRDIVLITHSQGGLVAQTYLAAALNDGAAQGLARVKGLIMFACPNSGSELFLTMRRVAGGLWRHPQERQLRPLDEAIAETHNVIIHRIIRAEEGNPQHHQIPVAAFAGAEDNVVKRSSALGAVPPYRRGVLPGDHLSIIQPNSRDDLAYVTLRRYLLAVLDPIGPPPG